MLFGYPQIVQLQIVKHLGMNKDNRVVKIILSSVDCSHIRDIHNWKQLIKTTVKSLLALVFYWYEWIIEVFLRFFIVLAFSHSGHMEELCFWLGGQEHENLFPSGMETCPWREGAPLSSGVLECLK